MATIPNKVLSRITEGLKKYTPLLKVLKDKDINESDTVVVVTDMLCDVFGFEKYGEITSEYAIKKTFCDLAIKIDGNIAFLIEVKAIGINLKSDHIKQAVDYGSNAGVDWVILTNGISWKIYKIQFSKPIVHELVCEFEMDKLSFKKVADLEMIFLVCKEGLFKTALEDFHSKKQFLNKHFLGGIILTDDVLDFVRKYMKKMNSEIKIDIETLRQCYSEEVIKREVIEGEKAAEANKKILKMLKSNSKKTVSEIQPKQENQNA